jgi:CheY-like chemotaxis protein
MIMPIHARYRIAIADDDPAVRLLATSLFSKHNYEVTGAENGVQALQVLSKAKPHVLISDIQMPQMDGYELLRIVRAWFPEIGVIAISGTFNMSGPHGDIVADDFLTKGSYSMPELLNCVDSLTSGYPLRSPAVQRRYSLIWVSRDSARSEEKALWIACKNCLHCFPFRQSEAWARVGSHIVQCPSCLESSTLSVAYGHLESRLLDWQKAS